MFATLLLGRARFLKFPASFSLYLPLPVNNFQVSRRLTMFRSAPAQSLEMKRRLPQRRDRTARHWFRRGHHLSGSECQTIYFLSMSSARFCEMWSVGSSRDRSGLQATS
jgi:hypothetical protein